MARCGRHPRQPWRPVLGNTRRRNRRWPAKSRPRLQSKYVPLVTATKLVAQSDPFRELRRAASCRAPEPQLADSG
jgi:hypothetical protein